MLKSPNQKWIHSCTPGPPSYKAGNIKIWKCQCYWTGGNTVTSFITAYQPFTNHTMSGWSLVFPTQVGVCLGFLRCQQNTTTNRHNSVLGHLERPKRKRIAPEASFANMSLAKWPSWQEEITWEGVLLGHINQHHTGKKCVFQIPYAACYF